MGIGDGDGPLSGLGTQIVETLVRNELRGSITWSSGEGGGTEVALELELPERRSG